MEARIIEPRVTFNNLRRDFQAAWDGVAANDSGDLGRGNFLFGFLATALLEWACRLCRVNNPPNHLIHELAAALKQRDSRYFTPLPPTIKVRGRRDAFDLPTIGGDDSNPLLWAVFVLVRNGLAHHYQQLPALLDDGRYLWISLRGAEYGETFERLERRRSDHLAFCEYRDTNIGIRVWPHVFFSDISEAIDKSGILSACARYELRVERFGGGPAELVHALQSGKHATFAE